MGQTQRQTQSQNCPLDLEKIEYLKKLGASRPEFMPSLIRDFLHRSGEIFVALSTEPPDAEKVFRLGHLLKGMAGNLGAIQMEQLGLEIENAGRNKNLAQLESLVTELASAMKETEASLKSVQNR